jgi:hypothetical protein
VVAFRPKIINKWEQKTRISWKCKKTVTARLLLVRFTAFYRHKYIQYCRSIVFLIGRKSMNRIRIGERFFRVFFPVLRSLKRGENQSILFSSITHIIVNTTIVEYFLWIQSCYPSSAASNLDATYREFFFVVFDTHSWWSYYFL